jgi:hypothetical protein
MGREDLLCERMAWFYLALTNTTLDLRVPYNAECSSSGSANINFWRRSTSIQHGVIHKRFQYHPLTLPPRWTLWRSLPISRPPTYTHSFTCVALRILFNWSRELFLFMISSFFFFFFFHGSTAPSGSGPPHYRGYMITQIHTTICRIPLDE